MPNHRRNRSRNKKSNQFFYRGKLKI